jgi:hypothetical protein
MNDDNDETFGMNLSFVPAIDIPGEGVGASRLKLRNYANRQRDTDLSCALCRHYAIKEHTR